MRLLATRLLEEWRTCRSWRGAPSPWYEHVALDQTPSLRLIRFLLLPKEPARRA